jgi:hypothetical protein
LKLEISCRECSEQIASGKSGTVYSRVCSVRDDCIYELECPQGHRTKTVLKNPRHEVLYLIGANAVLDGYFRDGIASFASSLERYFEFALRVILREKQVDSAALGATWKMMAKQSERQLGAFIAIWLMETGTAYTSLPQNQIDTRARLRNDVIHQGKIPTSDECLGYGQYVLDIISPIEQELRTRYANAHKDECFALARNEIATSFSPITVLSEFSVLSTAVNDGLTLEQALVRLRRVRERNCIPSVGAEHFNARTVTHVMKP